MLQGGPADGGDRDLIYSDDDIDDFSSGEEGSDSEPILEADSKHHHHHHHHHGSGHHHHTPQQQSQKAAAAAAAAGASSAQDSGGGSRHRRFRKSPRSGSKSGGGGGGGSGDPSARQRNLKQKFVALLKKFKVADPEELEEEEGSLDQKLSGEEGDRYLIWLLLLGDRLCKHATLGCFVCGGVRPPVPLFPLSIRRREKAYCQESVQRLPTTA